jgi:DNA repair exonuclease SbcCD ATPase subunit
MNVHDTLASWEREIAGELEAARAELAALLQEDAAAADAVVVAEREYRELLAVLKAIAQPSQYITNRAQDAEKSRSAARGRRAQIAGLLANARERCRELERARGQLGKVLNPVSAVEAA